MLRKENGFIDIITSNSLNPSDFTVSEDVKDDYPTFIIKHNTSPLEFWTRNSTESYFQYDCNYIPFSPTFEPVGYEPNESWFDNIEDVYDILKDGSINILSLTWKNKLLKICGNHLLVMDLEGLIGKVLMKSQQNTSMKQKKQLLEQISNFRGKLIENYAK